MTAPFTITRDQIVNLGPCAPGAAAAIGKLPGGAFTAQEARDAGCTMADLLWAMTLIAHNDREVERALQHWLVDCAEHVLPIWRAAYPADDRPRFAVDAGRDIADGEPSVGEGARVAAARAASDALKAGKRAASMVAKSAADCIGWTAASGIKTAWASVSAAGARKVAEGHDAWVAEGVWQYDALVAQLMGGAL